MIYIDLQNNNDILKYAIENGMIDLSYIRGQVEMVEKKNSLTRINTKFGKELMANGELIYQIRKGVENYLKEIITNVLKMK